MRRLTDWLFGFDFFISYSHADGRSYPRQLAARLRESDFSVFLDEEQYTAGEELNSATRRRVRMSKYLVVLVRPAVLKSRWVKKEVEESILAGRAPLPVIGRWMLDHGGAFFLQETFGERIWIVEEQAKEEESYDGEPSPIVVDELRRAFAGVRANTRRRHMISAVALLMTVLAIATTALYYRAETQRRASVAAVLDARAERRYAEAESFEAGREVERERCEKLRREHAAGGDAVRVQVLAEEIEQCIAHVQRLQGDARNRRILGRNHLRAASARWKDIEQRIDQQWIPRPERPEAPAIFSIECIKSPSGESLLLHYGDVDQPRFILLDGGGPRTYGPHLAPRLRELRNRWAPGRPLPFELVIASQTDQERIQGLSEMLRELSAGSREYAIRGLWLNTPYPLTDRFVRYGPSRGKWALLHHIVAMGIPVNAPFPNFVGRPENEAIRVSLADGLTITILHPTPSRMRKAQKHIIDQWKRNSETGLPRPTAARFDSPALERVIGPGGSPPALDSRSRDPSVINRASLVLLFEFRGRSFLYTGNATDHDIHAALHAAGRKASFDVMHIPHFGSDHNVSDDYFRRVAADHYLITGSGRHSNPEIATLQMICNARGARPRTMHFVHRAGDNDLEPVLNTFFAAGPCAHRRVFRPIDDNSLIVNLLQPVRY